MSGEGSDLRRLEDRIGYRFKDRALLTQALTHASAAPVHNERLEYLGDAVLSLIAAEVVYERFPESREGELTERKAHLVSRATLERVANRIGLAKWLRIGGGLELRASLPRSLGGNALEALLGAIHLDGGKQGLDRCRALVRDWLAPELESLGDNLRRHHSKKELQHLSQERFHCVPEYFLVEVFDHPECHAFRVQAIVAGRAFPAAWGPSKKVAERRAAWEALMELAPDLASPPRNDPKQADGD